MSKQKIDPTLLFGIFIFSITLLLYLSVFTKPISYYYDKENGIKISWKKNINNDSKIIISDRKIDRKGNYRFDKKDIDGQNFPIIIKSYSKQTKLIPIEYLDQGKIYYIYIAKESKNSKFVYKKVITFRPPLHTKDAHYREIAIIPDNNIDNGNAFATDLQSDNENYTPIGDGHSDNSVKDPGGRKAKKRGSRLIFNRRKKQSEKLKRE